jgi:phosphatidylglycerol:prolipoprotein diacylglycerol transferase
MRPILVQIPSKLLFFVALALAAVLFVRDLVNRQRVPGSRLGANPLLLVAAALAIVKFRSPTDSFIPETGTFSQPWLPVPIYAYGVMLGTSMIVGWFLAMRNAKQDGLSTEAAGAIYMWSAVYSIVGARLLYVVTDLMIHGNTSAFFRDPVEIVRVNNGGLVAYGGMIGGFFASWYGCHTRKIPLLQWVDVGSPSVVLGTGITRMGCFLFGCDFGRRSDLPWAVSFPKGSPAWHRHLAEYGLSADATRSFPVHPTQLYELLAGFFLFALLMYLRRVRRFSGEVFLGWVLGYGILRPLIEVLRDDDDRANVGPLSTSQFIGLVSVVLGTALLVQLIRRYRRDPVGSRLWERPMAVAAAGAGSASGAVGLAGAGMGGAGRPPRKHKKRR